MLNAPIVLGPNQPPQFYRGGVGIARFRGTPQPSEYAPEDWIGSTTSIFSRPGVGLTRLDSGDTLRDAIARAPGDFLGPDHVARYGPDPALLVKILDTAQRLVVHFHPDRDFAARHLGSRYGKTEAWIILDVRQSGDDAGCVYLGFARDADPAVIRRWMADQDTVDQFGVEQVAQAQVKADGFGFREVGRGDNGLAAQEQIEGECFGQHMILMELRSRGQPSAPFGCAERRAIQAVHQHAARVRLPRSGEQRHQCRLATARRPFQHHSLAHRDLETRAVEYCFGSVAVAVSNLAGVHYQA